MEYVTTYADETMWEKAWQREYKYGIILIYPSEPHRTTITALRDRYAWSQTSQCDAHISLSMPIAHPVTQRQLDEVKVGISAIKPFQVRYGPVVEKPQHRGVVLAVQPQDALTDILTAIELTSVFDDAPLRKYPYWAHMTIAEQLDWEQTHRIIDEVKDLQLEGRFELRYLSYAVPDQTFHFTERARVYLQI